MTSAGYIHDQRCPTNPEHGNVYTLENSLYCPHSDHSTAKPPEQCLWSFSEWEAVKAQIGESPKDQPPHPSRTRAIQVRKPRAGSKRRRRTRKG